MCENNKQYAPLSSSGDSYSHDWNLEDVGINRIAVAVSKSVCHTKELCPACLDTALRASAMSCVRWASARCTNEHFKDYYVLDGQLIKRVM